MRVQEDGRFERGGIPAGVYTLALARMRSGGFVPLTLKEIRLAEGEAKTLDIRKDGIPQSEFLKGVFKVAVFTPQGLPLPGCDLRLTGTNGSPKPTRTFAAHAWYAVPPGSYRLSAAFPGAQAITQTIEVKPLPKGSEPGVQDQVLNLTLAPAE